MTDTSPTDFAAAILVRGAKANNLRSVDVDIPKRKLVVFTGVSGSGKSSLAFDTVAAESQRMLTETFPSFVQNLMPHLPRPEVTSIEHLSAAIVVDQAPMGSNPRSTVGTATDTVGRLRTLFAQHGEPAVDGPRSLSFNDPRGACPDCEGTGEQASLDTTRILDETKSLNDGAITFPNFAVNSLFWKVYARSGTFDNDKPISEYSAKQREHLLSGSGPSVDTGTYPMAYEGILTKIRRLYLGKAIESLKPKVRAALEEAATIEPCTSCDGSRLNKAARNCRIERRNIADATNLQAVELTAWLTALDLPRQHHALRTAITRALQNMQHVGLGYLSLNRPTSTLSGGEAQRIRTVLHLDSALTELTYVFDEPAAGLHSHDTQRVIALLHQLRDKGNNVLVVEHHPDVINAADHIIDLGPRAGRHGGTIVFQGTPQQLADADTITAHYLNRRQELKTDVRTPTGHLELRAATRNNLQGIDVRIPLGCIVAITGVAGAGKTSLLQSLPTSERIALLDQTPIRGSRRSSTATYTGILETVRTEFAAANNVKANLFSSNSTGACPDCEGLGVTYTPSSLGADVTITCETCDGRRFRDDVLKYELNGKNIADVLAMPIDAATTFLATTKAKTPLTRLTDVGLGYITLGQPLTELSGGERQRLRLAVEMGRTASIYVLDEPTNGLHMADVETLVTLFNTLVDKGTSIIVAEHHLGVIANADWVIDLGPDAGTDGGRVVFEGTPTELAAATTHTGKALRTNTR